MDLIFTLIPYIALFFAIVFIAIIIFKILIAIKENKQKIEDSKLHVEVNENDEIKH